MPKTTTRRTPKTAPVKTPAQSPDLEVPSEPHALGPDELALIEAAGNGAEPAAETAGDDATEPTLMPPSAGDMHVAAPVAAAAATTITGQRVTALWADQVHRNARINLQTAGWKKLSTKTDSGSTTLTILAAHARSTGSTPTLTEDPAGTISSMYVW
ncbi:hypothetical protein [Luteipulveratus halotolerans]|uniref:Uncharacterized protein n=1 Tax=Luteipulveratus halotolerans TaxID=1631356 RepID=A0A0L6CMJ0_9MICO|nr:hypothetical protein [Luteipulveratus halotolerans]KNX38880.1 hypothetical protein VV01_19865 [Luteipulveratus halotolerans]